MSSENFGNEIWNEYQWEAYLNDIEKKSAQLRKFIASDAPDELPRWIRLLKENSNELEAVDAFIEEELQIEEAYFPEEEEEDDEWEDDPDFFLYDEEDDLFFDYDDDFDEGESWKELSGDFSQTNYGSIETLPVYNQSRELAAYTLHWAESLHPRNLNPDCNDFIGAILIIGAKVAGGYSFGFEQDFLGCNIAYTKKALSAANKALTIVQNSIKRMPSMPKKQYLNFHRQIFELRNELGIYVQELREQFNMGFE